MESMSNEVDLKGKIAIELSENNYVVRGKVLAAVFDGLLHVYEIKQELTRSEIKLLNNNLQYGLTRIESKLRQSAPVTVTNGKMFYADLAVVSGANGRAYLAIF